MVGNVSNVILHNGVLGRHLAKKGIRDHLDQMNVSTIQQKIVAVLHDVLEDTNTTVDELYELGCDNDIVEAILALTKLKGESRTEAAKRTLQNPIARVVKIADINDNMDLSRIHSPTDKDFERIKEYQLVRDILTQSI